MDTTLVIDTIKQALSLLNITCEVDVSEHAGSTVFAIRTPDSRVLIGAHGETLQAFTHLIKKMLENKVPREARYTIDVNGYHAQQIKSLEDQARVVAERARTFRYDIDMPAMSSYERMIVHSALKEMPDIDTASEGEGPLRHIVVRYKDPNAPAAPKPESAPDAEVGAL